MNICSIVLIAVDPSFVNGSYVLLSNNYVAILGVVFATIWTNRQNWNQPADDESDSDNFERPRQGARSNHRAARGGALSTIRFDAAPYVSQESDSESSSDLESGSPSLSEGAKLEESKA
jgi:hypothetical protein